jgi:hypothetical protein
LIEGGEPITRRQGSTTERKCHLWPDPAAPNPAERRCIRLGTICSENRRPPFGKMPIFCLSMILSENRFPLFRIMLRKAISPLPSLRSPAVRDRRRKRC